MKSTTATSDAVIASLALLHGDAAERRADDVFADRRLVERGRQAARVQDFDRRLNFLVASSIRR